MTPSLSAAIAQRFNDALPADTEFCSLRLYEQRRELLSIRRGVLQPPSLSHDRGVMITAHQGGGVGYAATSDLSAASIRGAVQRARAWAERTAAVSVFDFREVPMTHPVGSWTSPVERPWSEMSAAERVGLLRGLAEAMPEHENLVDWDLSLLGLEVDTLYLTNGGGRVEHALRIVSPDASVVANRGAITQRRSLGGGRGWTQQGGYEALERSGFRAAGPALAAQALELLDAPNCPTGEMSLVLDSDQMMLQIHESIGHPLELDRILGDERNYAGTSFVTLDMFGSYAYGSPLLNAVYDPSIAYQLASYGWDDEGTPATRQHLIQDGTLVRPLGGRISQARAKIDGVACARASSWNRPPIDRMANLNIEPGDSTFDELIGRVERGVFMQTNASWSIDDSRNKFQFGCELGRLIEDGELKGLVRNPNYRGISATFWRSLSGVGDRSTYQVMGTPYCGKGEPNQVIRVGHASPVCLFDGVSVFGGM